MKISFEWNSQVLQAAVIKAAGEKCPPRYMVSGESIQSTVN